MECTAQTRDVPTGYVKTINAEKETLAVLGHRYLNDGFTEGTIYKKGNKKTKMALRYDAYHDVLEFHGGGALMVLDPTDLIIRVDLGTDQLVVRQFEDDDDLKSGFLLLLDSGRYSLLKQYKKVIKTELDPFTNNIIGYPKFEETKPIYFISCPDGELIKFRSVKEFLKSLDSSQELDLFVKRNQVSVKNEETLITLVQYYSEWIETVK